MWHDHEAYFVRIGPDDHVCSRLQVFWFKDDRDQAWERANAFKEGAAAALATAGGLTSRFIANGKMEVQ